MKKEAYEVEYYEPKSVLAMQADRREEKHRRKQKKGIRAGRILLGVAILLFWEISARLGGSMTITELTVPDRTDCDRTVEREKSCI